LALALAWPGFAAIVFWRGRIIGMDWNEILLGGTTVYLVACIATLGRPLLVMNTVLPKQVRGNRRLMRRSTVGLTCTLLAILVLGVYVELHVH
ncbi:MAG TPA: hypothetical protein VFJ97_07645, partial [Dermatophilaceae bacterium]|nr:hypothetical protein [Dermatophilaceae bacterium]